MVPTNHVNICMKSCVTRLLNKNLKNVFSQLVELLLKHGANPLQPNSEGKTPADVASSGDMVKLLRKEIISSSSDSSSLDDLRSPMSPESNSSLKEEDFRNSDSEERGEVLPF